jgi:hypothetical protein
MVDKVIVTNGAALTAKYQAKGVAAIKTALNALVAADKKRGLATVVVNLDDAKAMKKLGAKPVKDRGDCRENKTAIDGLFKKLKPDYLMILGSSDVIPHQDLVNPVFKAGEDDDEEALGDLPYACDTPYGRDAAQFVGPTRVVGRLPDLTGAKEPSFLLGLLKTAVGVSTRPSSDYAAYFGLSALVWQGSTKLSIDHIFHNTDKLMLAPDKGPNFAKGVVGTRAHFINCHGAPATSEFYGQKGKSFPVSLSTKAIGNKIREGTVVSAECCYGAQLYDSITLALDMPICQSYLKQGAYGFFGSTTIAYGPADKNGAADLICQFFLASVVGGASIGRAALTARQQFVDGASQMDPVDLKTLAQFCLYGDPSVQPVAADGATEAPSGKEEEKSFRFQRSERRLKLKQKGDDLQKSKPTASKEQKGVRPAASAKAALANIAREGGLPPSQSFTAFTVKGVNLPKGTQAKMAGVPSRYYLTVGIPKANKKLDLVKRVAVVAKELDGHIVGYRIYEER